MTDLVIRVRADGTAEVARGMRNVDQAVGQMGGKAGAASQQMGKLGATAGTTGQRIGELRTNTLALVGVVAGAAAGLLSAASASAAFGRSMAEVSTLVDDSWNVPQMSEDVRALTREFGGDVQKNAKALYDIISAGAADSAEAMDTLTTANKLAIGGVTDVSIAADGLTSALNAYGDEAGTATDVSDAFFVAVKAGKTTVDEIAGAIGQVAPIAATAGVSLEELLAGTAALTAGGVSTSQAMTQIRAAISSVITPSSQATQLAEELGIQFDAAALKSMGLAGFLDMVKEATGGNVEQMGRLFGSVEGLGAVLTLTGNQAGTFSDTLDDMATRAGATEEAMAKMWDGPGARAARFQAALNDVRLSIGDAVTSLSPLLIGLTGLVNRFNELDPTTRTWIAGLAAGSAALLTLTTAVRTLGFAMAPLFGPAGLIAAGIGLLALLASRTSAASTVSETLGRVWRETGRESDLEQRIEQLNAQLRENSVAARDAAAANLEYMRVLRDQVGASIAQLRVEMEVMDAGLRESAGVLDTVVGSALEKAIGEYNALSLTIGEAEERLAGSTAASTAASTATRELAEDQRVLAEAQRDVEEVTGTTARATRGATEALSEQAEQIVLNDAHVQAYRASLESTGPAARQAAEETASATTDMAESWRTLQNNIQNLFASTFERLFSGAWDGWRSLLSSMWRLFAQFAAQLASQRLITGGSLFGLAGGASAADAGAMIGGNFLSGFGSAISGGLGSVLGGLFSSFGSMIGGSFGFGLGSTGAVLASQGLFSGGVAALGNIGSLIGAGEFAMALGAAVPFLLPIAIGLTALLGKSTPPRAYALADASTGKLLQVVEKKGGEAEGLIRMLNMVVESTSDFLTSIDAELAEGAGTFDFHVNPDRLRLTFVPGSGWEDRIALDVDPEDSAAVADGVAKMMLAAATEADFSAAAEPVAAFFESLSLDMIKALPQGAAEEILQMMGSIGEAAATAQRQLPFLADVIRSLGQAGELGAKELAQMTVAMVAIGEALSTSPMEVYEAALEDANRSILAQVDVQRKGLQSLIDNYDGSLESTQALAQGLIAYKNAAVAAAQAIAEAQRIVEEGIGNAIEQIMLDTMTESEKWAFYLRQADEAREAMLQATSPEQVVRFQQEYASALLAAWNLLSDEEKRNQRQFFIDSLEALGIEAEGILGGMATNLEQEYQQMVDAVSVGMINAFEAAGLISTQAADEFRATVISAGNAFAALAESAAGPIKRAVESAKPGGPTSTVSADWDSSPTGPGTAPGGPSSPGSSPADRFTGPGGNIDPTGWLPDPGSATPTIGPDGTVTFSPTAPGDGPLAQADDDWQRFLEGIEDSLADLTHSRVVNQFADAISTLVDNLAEAERLNVGTGGVFALFDAQIDSLLDGLFGADQQAVTGTLLEQHQQQRTAMYDAAEAFGTGALSLDELINATDRFGSAAQAVAAFVDDAMARINDSYGSTIERIRRSLLDQGELYEYLTDQAESLAQELLTATDPQQIAALADQINALVGDAYSVADDDQQQVIGEDFISFLEEVQRAALERLEAIGAEIEGDAAQDLPGEIRAAIKEAMAEVAASMKEAAEKGEALPGNIQAVIAAAMRDAVRGFADAADRIPDRITVTIPTTDIGL